MRFSLRPLLTSLSILLLSHTAFAERLIVSKSLQTCMKNSQFTANHFDLVLTPGNNSAALTLDGYAALSGYVIAQIELIAYGFSLINTTVDPCDSDDFKGFCNMSRGKVPLPPSNFAIPGDTLTKVPSVAYWVPDIDGLVRIRVYARGEDKQPTGAQLACLEIELSNTKTVYQKAVGWVTAVIAGLGLIASGVTSGLGHPNTAAHVAANAVSLFGVFQAQAIIGLTSVSMPPIVQSWTQNFQWSMGIINVGFVQQLATWYQRATGGTPTTYLATLSYISVQVQKRAVKRAVRLLARTATEIAGARGLAKLMRRADDSDSGVPLIIVRGIDRVGFRAGIEQTNIFMTGLVFFLAVLLFTAIIVAACKAALEGLARGGSIKSDRFLEFRNGWRIVLKGILFRLVLLGYVQMSILCLWQLVERDSPAEVVLALFVFLSLSACLAWACFKVVMLAKRSIMMHKNPGYILYSDPACLNKWGFLYVSYKATSYYFVIVLLGYILLKAMFIAFAQASPPAQAIGLIIIEALYLVAVSVLKPWMDKKTNAFNISIASINFVNAIFLLMFSDLFGQPPMVSGIMGVLFALYNLIFMTVLLVMVLISSVYAVMSKNPETRYQPMRDDRGSFIKSQTALTTELDALGATARGDNQEKTAVEHYNKDVDDLTSSSDSLNKPATDVRRLSQRGADGMYPSEQRDPKKMYTQVNESQVSNFSRRSNTSSPFMSPKNSYHGQPQRPAQNSYGPQQFRNPASGRSSPWQRGAGYD